MLSNKRIKQVIVDSLGGMDSYTFDDVVYIARAIETAVREECAALHDNPGVLAPVGNSAYCEAYQDGWVDGTRAYQLTIERQGEQK